MTIIDNVIILAAVALMVVVALVYAIRLQRQLGRTRRDLDDLITQQGLESLSQQAAADMDRRAPILVVIPAYNEARSIGAVLATIPREVHGVPVRPLVVVDGGTDGTERVARERGAWVVRTPYNRGQGAALQLGFDFAEAWGCRAVVTMDADGQHDPRDIRRLVRPLVAGKADMVIGTRDREASRPSSSMRRLGIIFLNALLRATGVNVSDCSSGFRAYHPATLSWLRAKDPQYSGGEILVLAARAQLRIHEVGIVIRRRTAGQSKKGTDLRFALGFTLAMIRAALRPLPLQIPVRESGASLESEGGKG